MLINKRLQWVFGHKNTIHYNVSICRGSVFVLQRRIKASVQSAHHTVNGDTLKNVIFWNVFVSVARACDVTGGVFEVLQVFTQLEIHNLSPYSVSLTRQRYLYWYKLSHPLLWDTSCLHTDPWIWRAAAALRSSRLRRGVALWESPAAAAQQRRLNPRGPRESRGRTTPQVTHDLHLTCAQK